MSEFVAFEAAISLLKESKNDKLITDTYKRALSQNQLPREQIQNVVKDIYAPFNYQQVSDRIAQLLTPENLKAKFELIYQTVEGLHISCPNHTGDWYFTGNYPTPGGNKVANQSFINYVEGKTGRAY